MPNYEESFLLDPSKFVFLDEKLREKFFFLEKELKSNPFIKFNCLLSQEIRELKAFSQIYEKKTYYESYRKKIMTKQKALQNEMQEALMGKTSLKSFFMMYF